MQGKLLPFIKYAEYMGYCGQKEKILWREVDLWILSWLDVKDPGDTEKGIYDISSSMTYLIWEIRLE